MTTTKEKLLTADDLMRLDAEGVRGELIRGVFCEVMSSVGEHGEIVMNLGGELRNFIRPRRLGRLAGSDGGVRLERNPDTVREPDIAYISAEKMPLDVRATTYYEVVPDMVVEVASQSDTLQSINDKARMWLDYGTQLVWVAFPNSRSVDVHPAGGAVFTLGEGDTLDGGDVLPGFSCAVRDIFDV